MDDRSNDLIRIAIPTLGGYIYIYAYNILYCEAAGNYTDLYLKNGKKICSTLSLAKYELKLKHFLFFFRIHKSHIANLNCADHYEKGKEGRLFIDDKAKTMLIVSRTHKKEFLDRWENRE
jgi:two-component system LytT family response regulator